MKTIHTLLTILLVVTGVSCRTAPTHVTAKRDYTDLPTAEFTITVSGTSGIPFTGTITRDGSATKTGGTIPATFHVSTHELAVSFQKAAASGSIEVHIAVDGKGQGMSSTSKRFGGVRAQVVCTRVVEQALFTTY